MPVFEPPQAILDGFLGQHDYGIFVDGVDVCSWDDRVEVWHDAGV